MKYIWKVELEPNDLLRIFLNTYIPQAAVRKSFSKVVWTDISEGKCALIWDRDPKISFVPPIVLIADQSILSQVLPKIMAIPGTLSPVTAFCHTWDKSAANLFAFRECPKVSESVCAGFVGLIIAELYGRHGLEMDLRRVGMGVVTRMFSHSSARLVFSGGHDVESNRLLIAWQEAAALTKNHVDPRLLATINFLSAFLRSEILGSLFFDGTTQTLCRAIQQWSQQSGDLLQQSFLDVDIYEITIAVKSMSREQRFSTIEKTIIQLRRSSTIKSELFTDLLCGYLLSLIDSGSLDFFNFAFEIDRGGGYVACSYAMCTGLLGGPKFLWKGEGFGFNIFSSSLRGSDDAFQVLPDLSLNELKILRGGIKETGFEFRTKNASVVEVELLPNITGCFSNGTRRDAVAAKSGGDMHIPVEFTANLDRAEHLITSLKNTLVEMRAGLSPSVPTSSNKKRYYKRDE